MIKTMDYLDPRFELNLMLVPTDKRYFNKLQKMADKRKNIRILPPVSLKDIVGTLNRYDIGLYLLAPTNFNNLFALPNKFFEFIQARLCIAISPSPEMAKIVRKYELGVVGEDFSPASLAKKISDLTPEDIWYFKNQTHKYARELSAEKENEKLLKIVKRLIG